MPNKLSQFWQELKRRKVTRVITVYAATAFVILELADIITPSLRLPDWTVNLVLLLLCVGFVVAVILSWIYDVHPEGGIVKTEPVDKVKAEDIPVSSNSWKIASYISFVVIVALIVLNIVPRANNKKEILEKSIAVLPFINDSPDQERMYFINGTMEAILNNLSMIEDLRVPGRTSVEQYRDNPKPIPVVAEEMDVSYILEGSGHRDGNNVRLIIQLLDGREDQHLWSKTYDADIEEIFAMQSEIAQLVAAEIEAVITPVEKQLIEKIPTAYLTAYDFYQKGKEEYYDYLMKRDLEALERADDLYHKALEIDSSYALAYVGLADIVWAKTNMEEYFKDNFLDSVLTLVNLALSYDDQSCEAYAVRGRYYGEIGRRDLAIKDLETAISFNPNHGRAYGVLAGLYFMSDFITSAELFHKASNIDRGPFLAAYLGSLGHLYFQAGFSDISFNYFQERLKLTGDSTHYCGTMGVLELWSDNYADAIEYSSKAIEYGATWSKVWLARALVLSGQPVEALEVYESWIIDMKEMGALPYQIAHRIAYAYWINDLEEEAEYYFDRQIEYCEGLIEKNRPWAQDYFAYYDLAAVYAFRGEKEKAYENLRKFNQAEEIRYQMVLLMKRDELFDSIRDEPEFKQIVRDVEAKYQALHERARQWMEDNEML